MVGWECGLGGKVYTGCTSKDESNRLNVCLEEKRSLFFVSRQPLVVNCVTAAAAAAADSATAAAAAAAIG